MSIDRLRGRLRRSQALRYEIKNSGNLLARHVELFHYFLDAQVLQIFDHRYHGQPRMLEQPVAAGLLEQRVSLEDAQRLACHADPHTTRLYDRRNKKITRKVGERISL